MDIDGRDERRTAINARHPRIEKRIGGGSLPSITPRRDITTGTNRSVGG